MNAISVSSEKNYSGSGDPAVVLESIKEHEILKRLSKINQKSDTKLKMILIVKEKIEEYLNEEYKKVIMEKELMENVLYKTYDEEFKLIINKNHDNNPQISNFIFNHF